MADINNVGKFGKNSGVDLNSIKGGLKKDVLKTEEQKSIFDAVDTDKNGILDENEVKSFKEKLDSSSDGVISKKEAKQFLKSLNLNEVDQKELLKFLLDYSLNTENVQEIRVKEENGQKLVEIVYKDGTTEVVNHDKSSVVTTPPDENGDVTVSYLSADKNLTKTSVTNAQGDVTETEYLEDGETPASTIITGKDGSISTIAYEEGKPISKEVRLGSVTSNYSYTEDGVEVLNSKVENEGIPTKERRTEYSYDENGVVTANITELGKTSVQTIVDDKVQSETITEEGKVTVNEYNQDGSSKSTITEDGKTTVVEQSADGITTETVTTDSEVTTTVYNSENKRLSKTKVVDGQEYTIQYDGEGNTVGIIVQNGESPALIAKRFGCDVNELLELNKDQVKGKGKGRYFLVASEIKIPGEIEPDAKALQNRQSKEEAVAAYEVVAAEIQAVKDEVEARKNVTFTEKTYNTFEEIARNLFKQEGIENPSKRQLDARIADLKKDNPDLKDGELIGKTITAGVSQERFDSIKAKEEAAEVARQDAITQKESAKSIYKELMSAIDGWNDDDAIYKALKKIDNPTEMAEVERLLAAKGYKADNYYSAIEKFMYKELGDSKSYDYSFDEMESQVNKWISNGAYSGDAAVKAQARLAARLIIDGCDGLGTDVDETKEGIRLIKTPKPTGDRAADNAAARQVYAEVNRIIKGHSSFGGRFKDLKDYLDGDLWDGEIKYLDGIIAQNNAIEGNQKATAVKELVREAVEGGGTDIEYLKQAIMAIDSPEDRAAIESQLKAYCDKKGIKPQIAGQDYLQAILYDECDTFLGVSTNHEEIRKFNEMLIEQGAYSAEEAAKLRAETAALQMLDGGFSNFETAAATIKDPETYAQLDAILKAKGYKTGVEGFVNKSFSSQVDRDKIFAQFAGNNLLSNEKASQVATRLLQNSDYDTRALGFMAIRNSEVAIAVDAALKQKGSSLGAVLDKFNAEKAEYKAKAAFWDGLAMFGSIGLGSVAEYISDEYRENTDISNNLYLEADTPIELTPEQIAAYNMTVQTLEDGLAQMKADYQDALDSQGVVSDAVNHFCQLHNLGTTRDEVEARLEHEEETVRLLKLAAQGKLTKIVDGKTVPVTFEEVFTERQSAVVSANGITISTISKTLKADTVNFDVAKVEKVANKAQTIVAMDFAKDNIAVCWSELDSGLKSNSNQELSIAINDTLQKLSQMSGKEMNLSAYGYQMKDGVIVDSSGKPVSASELKEIAKQLKQGLSDVSQALFGVSIPVNKSYDDVVDLLEDSYEDKMEAFKQEYRDAFGQEATDEMIENYISTINSGKMVVNIVGAIGAVIAAPFTGGGSLAVFAAAAGVSMGLNALEKSTDADGYTNTEWTSDAEQALWDGALAAVGYKVGMAADKLVTQGFKEGSNLAKVANSLMNKNKALIQKFGPNLSQESVEKAAIWLSRAEATFGEVSSDTVQSIVQSYCMEGELNMESFVSGMIMSVAGNAAGHTFSAFGDVKTLKQQYQAPAIQVKQSHNQTPTLDSVLGDGSKPGGVKLGDAKAKVVNDEIDAMLANPETNEVDLAEAYGKLDYIQNKDVRRQAQNKILAAVENLSEADQATFKLLNTNRLRGDVENIISSARPLESADVRVINDYIKNETDPAALAQLQQKLNTARSAKKGVTADFDALDVAITKRVGELGNVKPPVDVGPAKPVADADVPDAITPLAQSQKFAATSRIDVGERIVDGYRDGGRSQTFDLDGNIVDSNREIIVVDRSKDTKLQSIISDFKAKANGMSDKQKAAYLQSYINDLVGNGSVANRNLDNWVPANAGQDVLLGDIVTAQPPIAVCRHRSLLYKILGDEVGLKVELQRGNFSNGTPAGSGGHAWNTVRFDDGSSAIFDAMHNKTSVTTPGQVDDYAKQYFAMDDTPLYNEGLKPLDVQQPKVEPSVNPKSDIQNPEINTPAGRIASSMDSMSEADIPPELKSAWANCKAKFRETVDLLEDLQPKAALEKAKELAAEMKVIASELTGIAKVKFMALIDKIDNYLESHNIKDIFEDIKVKAGEVGDKIKNSAAYQKSLESIQSAYASIKAKDIPAQFKKLWAECGVQFDKLAHHIKTNDLPKAMALGKQLLAKLKSVSATATVALKAKLAKLIDDLGDWLKNIAADLSASSKVDVEYSPRAPRSTHPDLKFDTPKAHTQSILSSKNKQVQTDFLSGLKNEDGTLKFTPEQVKQIVDENPSGVVDSAVLYGLFKDVKTPEEFLNALDALNAIQSPSELKFVKNMLGLEKLSVKADGTFGFAGRSANLDSLTIEEFLNIRRKTKLPEEDFDNCLKEFLTNEMYAKALVKTEGGNVSIAAFNVFSNLETPTQFAAVHKLVSTAATEGFKIAPDWKILLSNIKSQSDVDNLGRFLKSSRINDVRDFNSIVRIYEYDLNSLNAERAAFAKEFLGKLSASNFKATYCEDLVSSFRWYSVENHKDLILKYLGSEDYDRLDFAIRCSNEISATSDNAMYRYVARHNEVPFDAWNIAGEIEMGLIPVAYNHFTPVQLKAVEYIVENSPDGRFEVLGFREIVDRVKTEQDFENLTKLLEFKKLDTFTLLQALESGVTDPKKINALIKDTMDYSESLAKDLRQTYSINPVTAHRLVKLHSASPARYQKIVDSGLLDLIKDKKVSESILEDVSSTTFLSNRTLKDIRKVASGEANIPSVPKSELEAISRHVANGDVCEVDGALFVNDNGKPVRLQISKEKFEELFPPLSTVSFKQGALGDCWLISTLDNLMDLPGGRVQLYSMLRQEGDDIFVTFPDTGKSIKFTNGQVAGAGTYLSNSHIANAPKGLQLIEQAYAVHRIRNSANLYADGEITDIQEILKTTDVDALMKRLDSGNTSEAMAAITGKRNSSYYKLGTSQRDKRISLAMIESVANRDDVLIAFGTKSNRLLGRVETTMNSNLDMFRNHAYSLKGYDPERGMVYITNPWHSQVITEVPVYDFVKYVEGLHITRLDGQPVNFDKNGVFIEATTASTRSGVGSAGVDAPVVEGAFTDRIKNFFGGSSSNDVKAVMKNVTGPDGTPKYTKAQINDLLEKSQVPVPDEVLTEFLNFPVTPEIDFEIKQQVIQQLKSPEDVQVLSSLMKFAKTDGADFNLAQIGDMIDIADFSGKGISNPAEIFDRMRSLFLIDDPYSVPIRFDKDDMLDFISNIKSEAHKEALMTMLNSANTHSDISTINRALSNMEEESVVHSFNQLAQRYPDAIGMNSEDLFAPYVMGLFSNLSYDTSLANFQKIVLNDLVNEGASLERISDVVGSLSFNIHEMSSIADPQGIMTLIKNGESGDVINYIIREGQPVSVVDTPAMKYMRANGYPIDQDHFDDITALLETDLSTPQQVQAFNSLLAAKDLGLQTVEISNIVSSIKSDADVARLQSMIDSGKVDTFQFIRDIKPVVTPDAPDVKPGTPVAKPDGVEVTDAAKTPAQIRLDEIKRLKATYGLDVNQTQGLVELKIKNPKRFAKIEDSGLLDLIRDGKIDAKILERLDDTENMFFSNRTLAEIRRMANGEPLVPTIPKSEIEAISKHVANGNVCEIDGALYVNDNGRPVRLKISKDAFEKLFPPLGNVAFRQGDVGDCWFVSTLENLMDKPAGRVSVYQLFEQQGDDILVRFPGQENAVLFNKGLLAYNGRGPAIQSAERSDVFALAGTPVGAQMIEQAYAVHRLQNGARAYDNVHNVTDISRLTDTSALLKRMSSGTEKEALLDLLGDCDVEITRNKAKITQMIEERANDPNFVIEFGTNDKPGFQVESVLDEKYDLYSTHAYAIKGYNPETGMVYISNPWSSHTITEVPMYELTKHMDNMTIVDLRTVQRADLPSASIPSGVEKEGIFDIFKKKKPNGTVGIVENLPPELRDLRTRLLSSETPTTFDKAHFESWAKDNGLELRYTSNGTVAEFYDQGKRVRRITEDSTKPGMIYDDRISYYDGNGELVGGRLTYSWGKPLIYDVVDGNPTNLVTIDDAGNWIDKNTGLKVSYNPLTGLDEGMHGSVFSSLKGMFGGSRHSIPEGVPTDVPESISSRAKFQSGFTTETSGIASSVPSVSSKLRKAIDMEAAGKTLVTQLDSNVNPSSISRYVKDGEVCAIGDTLYVNDNGAPVQLKLSKEKFEELFPPVGCATAEQSAHHTCWLVSEMNAMLDSSGGRVQLYTMLEQDGNDILVHLKNRKLPIRFENGQPLRGYSELQMGENAAPGLDMIYQSVLSERMNAMGGVAQKDVTNIKDFDIIEMTNYSGRMQGTTLGHRALVNGKSQLTQLNHPNLLAGEDQIMAALEKFKPGEDMFTVTFGAHHRHVVDYNPETKMITFHDPYNGGVDRTCPVSDLLNQYQLTAQYYPRSELTAGVADVSPTPVKPAVTTPSDISVKPQPVKPTNAEQKSTVIMSSWREVATTADGSPIKAKIQGDVVIISKNGKETEIPIAKGEEIPIHETSTDSFLIIKREGFRTTITTSKTPDLDGGSIPARPTDVEVPPVQPQTVTVPSKPQTKVLSSGVESEIGTINGRPLKAKYVSLSADRVATVEINGKAYNISAGSSLDVADGVTLKCDKFGRVSVTNNQGVSIQPQPRTGVSNDYQSSARQRGVSVTEPKGHMSAAQTSVSGSVLSQADMDVIANMRGLDEDMQSVVAAALNDFGVRMSKGQMPSREMMQQVTEELSVKYGVNQSELTRDIESVMSRLDDWDDLGKYNFRYTEKRNIEFGLDQDVIAFKIKKGLVPENQLNASNDILAELESRLTNGEIPSSEMMSSVAQDIATKYGTTVDDVMPLVNGSISNSKIKRFAKYFEKPLDKNLKAMQDGYAPIDREIGNLREAQGLPRETDAQLKAQEEARLREEAEIKAKQEAEAQAKAQVEQERQAILDAYKDVYPEVSEAGFRDGDSAVKLILLMEDYDATNITYENFDQQSLYGKIYGAGITKDADMDIAFNIIKERFHANVIAEEVRISDLKSKYKFQDVESIQDSDNIIAILKERQANGEPLTNADFENVLADNWHNQFDIDAIKQRVLDEPDLHQYLNDNLHLDIYNHPRYLNDVGQESLDQVVGILDNLKARVRNGEELTLDVVQSELDALHDALSQNGGFVSTEQYWVLQDILRNDPELSPLSKGFVEDIITGGYESTLNVEHNLEMSEVYESVCNNQDYLNAVGGSYQRLTQIANTALNNVQKNIKIDSLVSPETLEEIFMEADSELRSQGVFLSESEREILKKMISSMSGKNK